MNKKKLSALVAALLALLGAAKLFLDGLPDAAPAPAPTHSSATQADAGAQ